ncbi:aminodeoxychorismate synthase component I [Streptomyces sp. NBC_00091]|uniref:aminodeoxychorismate synthase component I n=1 Tax=Streptomyces sp. NBC_00091 TaxID=2975648 RepID=UPI00224FA205|nr:aminodeoxychorismate synthase component I [Streptomyces sp. NBC_00091]MCX5380985.1 aminodeoxychorismate synthase component I [Streptomyces sp. NBC_00091]
MRTLLIDNHDSYTYNLFQLLAEVNGQEPVVIANDAAAVADLDLDGFDNIVISPGPGHPARSRDFGVSRDVLVKASVPVLGVCLGHQGLAVWAGGEVVPAPVPVHGEVARVRHDGDELFAGIPEEFGAVRYHSLCVAQPLPSDLEATAWSEDGVVMALRHRLMPRWGVQFHPESIETEYGRRMLANFRDLTLADRAERTGGRPAASASAPAPASAPAETAPAEAARAEAAPAPQVRPRPAAGDRTHYALHVAELDTAVDTESAFASLFAGSRHAFWLDSARVEPGLSRFSFLGDARGPLAETVRYRVDEGVVEVDSAIPARHRESVFDYLQRELARRVIDAPPLPFDFTGGYVGYFGYELKGDCGSPNRYSAPTPDAVWIFADRFLAVDHQEGRTYLLALSTDPATADGATRWLADTAGALARQEPAAAPAAAPSDGPGTPGVEPRLARDREAYVQDVLRSQEYLTAGESYEICLTNVAEIPAADDGFTTYRRLRRANPAPYAAYLRLDGTEVACSSPERFLKITADRVAEAKPIKGTAPRGATPAEDEHARRELIASAKTRAENLMIVDLMRNDLGRVCEVGSVHVPVLMAAESYATVHQLVSTIRGTLKDGNDALDCVRACFPGGSMTGAPKQRTLEIIESLEGRARGIYSGAIGYLSCNGTTDLNIVIRTMVLADGRWRIGAGGAIVLGSDPHDEYDEMLLKANAPARALLPARPDTTPPAAERTGSDHR